MLGNLSSDYFVNIVKMRNFETNTKEIWKSYKVSLSTTHV